MRYAQCIMHNAQFTMRNAQCAAQIIMHYEL